jgi:hypothetical protein
MWRRFNLNVRGDLLSFQKAFAISPTIFLFVVGFDVGPAAVSGIKRCLKILFFTLVQIPCGTVFLNKDEWIRFNQRLLAIHLCVHSGWLHNLSMLLAGLTRFVRRSSPRCAQSIPNNSACNQKCNASLNDRHGTNMLHKQTDHRVVHGTVGLKSLVAGESHSNLLPAATINPHALA